MLEIVMLHNVKKEIPEGIGPISDYAVSERQLENFIASRESWLKLSPSDLYSVPKDKKAFLLTFDDGYLDNLTCALPVLERHNIPCIIFCTTGFVNKSVYPYEVELAEITEKHDKLKVFDDEKERSIDSYLEKKKLYQQLRIPLKNKSHHERDGFMESLAKINNYDRQEFQKEQFFSWNDIVELSKHPLITFGAHTVHHEQLSAISVKRAYHELVSSKEELESYISKNVRHFSYPYGSTNSLIQMMTYICGFEYAFSTEAENLNEVNLFNKKDLPRIDISNLL